MGYSGRGVARGLTEQIMYEDLASLPEPHDMEWEEAKEIYRSGMIVEQASWFVMGYAASCVAVTYGEGSLDQFAYECDANYATVAERRRIYRRVTSLEPNDREQILGSIRAGSLSYSHLLLANPIEDNERYINLLREAHDNSYSKRMFAQIIASERALPVAPTLVDEAEEGGELVYEGAEEVVAMRLPCPHCKGTGEVYTLDM